MTHFSSDRLVVVVVFTRQGLQTKSGRFVLDPVLVCLFVCFVLFVCLLDYDSLFFVPTTR